LLGFRFTKTTRSWFLSSTWKEEWIPWTEGADKPNIPRKMLEVGTNVMCNHHHPDSRVALKTQKARAQWVWPCHPAQVPAEQESSKIHVADCDR
jgi:hypothetical protein